MSLRTRRSVLLPITLALLLVLAGCLGGATSELPDRAEVEQSLSTIDAVEGDATIRMQVNDTTTEMHMAFVERTHTAEFRATMTLESSNASLLMVSNGSSMWVYNRTADTVRTIRFEGLASANWSRSVRTIGGIFEMLGESTGGADVSVSPLPAVPGGGAAGAMGVASMPAVGNVSVTYQGMETVGGRDAYAVDLAPAEGGSLLEDGTIWFDAERYYPIKQRFNMSVGGQQATVTVVYNNLTFNPDIPEGAFTFEPPDNATVTGASESLSVYANRDELGAAASQSLPEPALPNGYEFAQGSRTTSDETRVLTLQYANGTRTLVVSKQTPPGEGPTDGESVDVAGHEGTYVSASTTSLLTWVCEGTRYQLTGDYAVSTLDSIAESMACE